MVRAPCFDKNGMKKGAWSEDEDNKLRTFIQKHGHPNWQEIPKLAGLSRCGKSCRLRWMNYLDPTKKHGNFTKEEEDLIITLHNKFGNKWSKMAAQMPGRSDNEIKNHWHTHLKTRTPFRPNVSKNQQHSDQNLEPQDHLYSNPKEWFLQNPNSTIQQEVEILVAVLSSSSSTPSSSSSSTESSPCNSMSHATDHSTVINLSDHSGLQESDTASVIKLSDHSGLQVSDTASVIKLSDHSGLQVSDTASVIKLSDHSGLQVSDTAWIDEVFLQDGTSFETETDYMFDCSGLGVGGCEDVALTETPWEDYGLIDNDMFLWST